MKEDIKEDLLIRYILDEADAHERRQVETWLEGGDAPIKRFEQTLFLLNKSRELAKVSPLTEEEAWESFKVRRANAESVPVRKLNPSFRWLQAAAAVLIIAAGSWAAWFYLHTQPNQWSTLTAYEKAVSDTLPDGSIIRLNKHSGISYSGRTVRLKGEAFFKVVHNTDKPFVVHTGDITITDIGTAFNVKSEAGTIEVIVESGIVRVSKKTNAVILKEKEMVLAQPGNDTLKSETNPDLLYQYYRTDEFVADHTPLGRLVKVLNEAYGSNIQLKGSDLAELPITGTYKRESLDKVLQVLLLTTPEIHRINKGTQIILTR
ncbi:FecR domain-containing protein [Mucilaginibacter sp. dw_454]|uniref:FecR domain-containing protein n=1 Tax=Mucilaginibacter sp. dw_454 TaxID=2720079 RepID=UPI001BD227C3|nr:FecR domain-containing protein [Mucilaginibacter sp. dw_454]